MEDVNYKSKSPNEHAYDVAYGRLQRTDRETANKLNAYFSALLTGAGEVDLDRTLSHTTIVEQIGHEYAPGGEVAKVVDAARTILFSLKGSPTSSASVSPEPSEMPMSLEGFQEALLNQVDPSPGCKFINVLMNWISGAGVEIGGALTGSGEGVLTFPRECQAKGGWSVLGLSITLPRELAIKVNLAERTLTLKNVKTSFGVSDISVAFKQVRGEWKAIATPPGREYTPQGLKDQLASFKWI